MSSFNTVTPQSAGGTWAARTGLPVASGSGYNHGGAGWFNESSSQASRVLRVSGSDAALDAQDLQQQFLHHLQTDTPAP